MLTFDKIFNLLLLVLVPVCIFLFHFRRNRGGSLPFPYLIWGQSSKLKTPPLVGSLIILSDIMFWLAIVLIILALAGPSKAMQKKIFLNRGMDIMFILDISPSMSAKDFGVENRLEGAKQIISQYIDSRENDAIGLVAFGDYAMIEVPPTNDYELLKQKMSELEIKSLGEGTAVGMGLAVGSLHLSSSSASEKIILLLTDGENNSGEIEPETAANLAAQMGVRIYTIGIGSSGVVEAEFRDPETGKVVSGELLSEFNEELLVKIAEQSGGEFFKADSIGSLDLILKIIDSRESVEKRVSLVVHKEYIHRLFITIALFLIGFYFFIRRVVLQEVL